MSRCHQRIRRGDAVREQVAYRSRIDRHTNHMIFVRDAEKRIHRQKMRTPAFLEIGVYVRVVEFVSGTTSRSSLLCTLWGSLSVFGHKGMMTARNRQRAAAGRDRPATQGQLHTCSFQACAADVSGASFMNLNGYSRLGKHCCCPSKTPESEHRRFHVLPDPDQSSCREYRSSRSRDRNVPCLP